MKNKPFYIDTRIAYQLGLSNIRIYLNGIEQRQVISAKAGRNGFVEFYDNLDSKKSRKHMGMTGEIPIIKKRGNVRVKINK